MPAICHANQLTAHAYQAGLAMGTAFEAVVVRARTGERCTLRASPVVHLLDRARRVVRVRVVVSRQVTTSEPVPFVAARIDHLRPASLELAYQDAPTVGRRACPVVRYIAIDEPGGRVDVATRIAACGSAARVSPFRVGLRAVPPRR